MLKDYCYPAIFEYEENGISLYYPDIDEAYTCADDDVELFRNAREVLQLAIEGRIEDKKEIPEPSRLKDIELKDGQHIVFVNVLVETKIKYIKKTLTIPENLNLRAIKAGLNFSNVLAEGLEIKLKTLSK